MVPSPKIVVFTELRIYILKENHIGSVVSDIIWYIQTKRFIDILLLLHNDRRIISVMTVAYLSIGKIINSPVIEDR